VRRTTDLPRLKAQIKINERIPTARTHRKLLKSSLIPPSIIYRPLGRWYLESGQWILITVHIYIRNNMSGTEWFSRNQENRYNLLGATSDICRQFTESFCGAIFSRSCANYFGVYAPPTATGLRCHLHCAAGTKQIEVQALTCEAKADLAERIPCFRHLGTFKYNQITPEHLS